MRYEVLAVDYDGTLAHAELGASHARTLGEGDAENDEAFLRTCGLAVAVQNAIVSVKALAHMVTSAREELA